MQLSIVKKYWYLGVYALAALVAASVMSLSLSYFAHADTANGTTSISGVTASTTDTGATISWMTDTPQTSQVVYGTTTSYGTFSAPDLTASTTHNVTLTNLMPNTLYHFIASSTDQVGNATTSPDMTFTTASSTPTTTPSGPNISGILTSVTDTGATITWTTDVSASGGVVNYGMSPGNYTASSTEVTSPGTTHSATLTGLMPNTTYYFTVSSVSGSNTATTSPEMHFTTNNTPVSPGPSISGITVMPTDTTALIQWLTDQPSSSQVMYGTSPGNYSASSTPENGLVINHMVTLTGLMPNTTYYFIVSSTNGSSTASTSPESNFTTSSSTSTSTSPDLQNLQNQINDLQNQINTLKQQITTLFGLIGNGGNNGNNGNGGTTTPQTGGASIDQNGETHPAGVGIDFGGRGFGPEEHVNVMLNGQKVGEGFTNLAGSFSTGTMSTPSTPGTYTYTFVGQNSGKTATATLYLQ